VKILAIISVDARRAGGRHGSLGGQCGTGGSVLVIVLWIAFGLVSIALYFGHSMVFAYRASDQYQAGVEADLAMEGAARYVGYILTNAVSIGQIPDTNSYLSAGVPIGNSAFWIIGRGDPEARQTVPTYGLIDEASKLNINTATATMLEGLPRMTPELAAAIVDWRDADEEVTTGGAESEYYQRRNPPYYCKNAPFETIEELRLVAGTDLTILYGEDANLNGILDTNENDGAVSPPDDNRDGRLDPGILEYVTVYSRESNLRTNGEPRINVNSSTNNAALRTVLETALGQQRAGQVQSRISAGAGRWRSLLEVYLNSGMTTAEFALVYSDLSVTNSAQIAGLVNVNTAPAAVLSCIPGIGPDKAPQIVAYRTSKTADELKSVAWVTQVLDQASAIQAGPYITTQSYQFSADIAVTGHDGKGYRRSLFIFDTSEGEPKILYRRDRGRLGWALGTETRTSRTQGKLIR
jgi:DNA uptake protein ComE-like DNA-binding protein